jgi:hypothetical protein
VGYYHSSAGPIFAAKPSLTEPAPIFERRDEGLDHLSIEIISPKLVELVEPEVIAAEVHIR